MRFSRCAIGLLAFTFLLKAHQARAQTSVYAAVVYDRFGFTSSNYTGVAFKSQDAGILGGIFYTFPSQSRFKAGIDGRVVYSPGFAGGTAVTGALRVSFVPNHNRLRPFFQLGGGVVSTQNDNIICDGFDCSTETGRVNSGTLQLDFGLDIRLTDRFDLRAVDYGASAGGSTGNAHAGVAWIGAGLVYNFHPTTRKKP